MKQPTKDAPKVPTAEEIKAMEEEMDKFYDQALPFLRKRHEYEKLNAEVQEYHLRGMIATMKLAEIANAQKKEKDGATDPEN